MRHPELLLPAGSPEVLKVAVHYGADAVYLGGEAFGLRAAAHNFTFEEMKEAVSYAHGNGVRVHVTANIFAHNRDIAEAEAYFRELSEIGPDAVLVADPGMFSLAKRLCPRSEIHISTQANTTNYESVRFWREMGADRVVLARELTIDEIREIREKLDAEKKPFALETFVHGAMCISYSGRCLLSNYFTGRDANRGACAHPCRWQYAVMEMTRPGEYLPVEENERGTYLFNSRDLCMVDHLPDLYAAGVDSFKIEGRMKNALYVATCARTYRKAMADYERDPALYEQNLDWYRARITDCTYRRFTTGFFYGRPDEDALIYDSNTYVKEYTYLGFVEEAEELSLPAEDPAAVRDVHMPVSRRRIRIALTQKNKFSVGETVEIMKPDGRDLAAEVVRITNEEGAEQTSAPHPQQKLFVELELCGPEACGAKADVCSVADEASCEAPAAEPYDVIRRNS